ncbi:MAG TPA: Asp-tRNA(Asn)/Glu-tRNA(Gln) amidotransferase GatCAB subunit A [Cellvibrionales bacterium]|nr:Asp-tRNA(Asn)/Glu-tRNA(Gln) amidotransferase GatCAB subunit A [Cellvibrionales bacterium]
MKPLHELTVAQIQQQLIEKKFSSREITQHYLNRIDTLNGDYNCYITVDASGALAAAEQADQAIAAGSNAPLLGVPIAHKDIFCTKGLTTTCGSKMLANFVSPYDATVVSKMKTAGAVMLGKTNMDEFAMGSSNETSFFGPVKNPWNLETVPGGSSGGSAAAVAAQLAPAATGTDTGGSIRQPAALCGITGIKPTYGRVSRYGMIAFASSLDQAGPMTKTAEDAAILLNSMSGLDHKDSTSLDTAVPDFTATLDESLAGLKIGIPKEYFDQRLDTAMADAVQASLAELEKLGAKLVDIELPNSALSVPAYYVIAPAEASSNLSRFDGVRYGYRCKDPEDLEDLYTRTRSEGFGDEVKRRILVGTYALSAGYYDAYYRKAQQIRRLIKDDFVRAFEQVDIIAGPTAPSTAFKFGAKTADPVAMYLEDIYTIAVNLAGLPAMSLPAGQLDNMPIGMQLVGNYFAEQKLLNVAHQFQLATQWHTSTPTSLKG